MYVCKLDKRGLERYLYLIPDTHVATIEQKVAPLNLLVPLIELLQAEDSNIIRT
jgi:hypothetical protein